MPVRVDIIDSCRTDNGYLAQVRARHPRAMPSRDVLDLVLNTRKAAGDDLVERLRIFGHGRDGRQGLGGGMRPQAHQVIAVDSTSGRLLNYDILALLSGKFTTDAVVQLHGCRVAHGWQGQQLCCELATLWQVLVQAGVPDQISDRGERFEGRFFWEADGRPGATTLLRQRAR